MGTTERKRRILVVDDDEGLRDLLSITLRGAGFETAVAYDGVDAWTKLDQFNPDAVALDLMMPRMSGAEFVQMARGAERKLPIIVVTAYWEKGSEDLLRQDPNVIAVLHKPLRYARVAEDIRGLLDGRAGPSGGRPPE